MVIGAMAQETYDEIFEENYRFRSYQDFMAFITSTYSSDVAVFARSEWRRRKLHLISAQAESVAYRTTTMYILYGTDVFAKESARVAKESQEYGEVIKLIQMMPISAHRALVAFNSLPLDEETEDDCGLEYGTFNIMRDDLHGWLIEHKIVGGGGESE